MSASRRASSATSVLAESIKSIGLYDAVPPTTSNGSSAWTTCPWAPRQRAVTA